MKLMIGDYEVEISARSTILSERKNAKDTGYLLNEISMAFRALANEYKEQGFGASGAGYYKMCHDIYDVLKAKGFYKDLGEE